MEAVVPEIRVAKDYESPFLSLFFSKSRMYVPITNH